MKKCIYLLVFGVFFSVNAQKEMPNISLKSNDNKSINLLKDFAEQDKIYVFSFWATWCAPCISELEAINELYEGWQKELKVEVIAVSIDDARTAKRVKPLLKGKNWPYKVLLDTNQDLKRALSIVNVPYTIVVKNQKIVHIQNGYTQGEEKELFEKLKSL
jgi:peroxiredoxin